MAHFAKLDETNTVTEIIVLNNDVVENLPFPESEPVGVSFCQNLFGGNWKQTSYNRSFRKNYASINGVYDADLDAFIPPKPYPSWLLDTNTCLWSPPIPYPDDGKLYRWDEPSLSWVVTDH